MCFGNFGNSFACSTGNDSILKIFGFSTVSSSWLVMFDYVMSFKKLESV